MDMVEKVRQAIFAEVQMGTSYGGGPGTIYVCDRSTAGVDEVVVDGLLDLTALARAAIAALREPNEAMLATFHDVVEITVYPDEKAASIMNDRQVWAAVLDAALTSIAPATPSSE